MLLRFLLSGILLCNSLCAEPVRAMPKRGLLIERLDDNKIAQHEKSIKRKIFYSRALKGSVIGAALLVIATCSWISFKKNPQKKDKEKANVKMLPTHEERIEAQLDQIAESTSELRKAEGSDMYKEILFKWDDFTQAIRISLLMLGAALVAPSVLKALGLEEEAKAQLPNSAYNKVQSFSKKMLKIPKLQATLQYYAHQLVGAQGESRIYFEKGLVSTCNHLNKQLEALLGYMNYRIKLKRALKPQIACEEERVVAYLKETTNEFYYQAENIINEDIDAQKALVEELGKRIDQFCCTLQQEIGHFALLENM